MHSPRSVALVALGGALITFICGLAATGVGIQSGATTGLTVRTVLVALSLFVLALWTVLRDPGEAPFRGGWLFATLILAWALNPLSWIGRSFIGQWWFESGGLLASLIDLVGWAAVAAASTVFALTRSDSGGRLR